MDHAEGEDGSGDSEPPALLTFGELADLSGLPEATLRYYQSIELIEPVASTSPLEVGSYPREDVEWVRFAACLSDSGMPIASIRTYAALRRDGPRSDPARLRMLEEHAESTAHRIEQLTRHLEHVRTEVDRCQQ